MIIGRYLQTSLAGRNDYPKIISNKGLRPDIVLFSKENSKVILVELTIPFESWLEQSHDYKTSKYEDLKKELEKEANMKITKKNWKRKGVALPLRLWRLEQEVSLQAPFPNFWDKLESIGVIEAKITENCSMWIWSKRNVPWNIPK